jgi:uncharacterized membrane protein
MKTVVALFTGISLCIGSFACGEKLDTYSGEYDPLLITYWDDMKPLLDTNCVPCHASDLAAEHRNGAPPNVNFDTYEAASASALKAVSAIQKDTMPPDSVLSDEEKELFRKWVNDGMPE